MKGNSMKEKVVITLSFAAFVGIMWLSSTQTNSFEPASRAEKTSLPVNNYPQDYIEDVLTETRHVKDMNMESNFPAMTTCALSRIETDILSFRDAFKYYRKCKGSDSSFNWKGNTYTTLLSEEVIFHIADSVEVKENNNEMSEIR